MKASEVKFPVCVVILKSRMNPITQTWETKLRKDRRFRKETYSVWIYDIGDCVTKIGYDMTYYKGHADIWVLENKNDLNNFWAFCERIQKKNPGWVVHLGLLPAEVTLCPLMTGGKCNRYENAWDNLEQANVCNQDYDDPESDFPSGNSCCYIGY